MPSLEDPGQTKLMPCLPISDFFFTGPRGGSRILRNVTLATNPLRISFYGKEVVISRYNYFKKLKKNHLSKIQIQQEKILETKKSDVASREDTYKIAKTIVHQGTLIPLPHIV
jgi:hypothetical protein